MLAQHKKQKHLHRVVLKYKRESRSVFVRAYDRPSAEKRALKQHPEAMGIDHNKFPLS